MCVCVCVCVCVYVCYRHILLKITHKDLVFRFFHLFRYQTRCRNSRYRKFNNCFKSVRVVFPVATRGTSGGVIANKLD